MFVCCVCMSVCECVSQTKYHIMVTDKTGTTLRSPMGQMFTEGAAGRYLPMLGWLQLTRISFPSSCASCCVRWGLGECSLGELFLVVILATPSPSSQLSS